MQCFCNTQILPEVGASYYERGQVTRNAKENKQ